MEENLTTAQRSTLQQFKVNVDDIMRDEYDDHFFTRWLIARDWDLKKSEKMLRDHLEWRKKNDIDSILDWQPPEVLRKYVPGGTFGHDKEGYPIEFELVAPADLRGMHFSCGKQEAIKYKIYATEILVRKVCPELSKKFNRRIDQVVMIVDFEGVGVKHYWKPGIDGIIELLQQLEANYPEYLHVCYIINAPSVFPIVYSLVKPFLSEATRARMQVFGKNWKPYLLKKIDADQLPVHWGGTATDPDGDPCCKSQICMGGPIPEKYYRKKAMLESVDMSQFTVATVQRGSSLQLDFQVKAPNSILGWNFWTDDKDIGFGVYRRTADQKQKMEEMDVIIVTGRVDSHMIPETGSIQCDHLGTYVIRFDNTYSWLNAKKISYLIEVIVPDNSLGIKEPDSTNL